MEGLRIESHSTLEVRQPKQLQPIDSIQGNLVQPSNGFRASYLGLCVCDIVANAINEPEEINMLWTIFVVLLILWLLGFSLHIAGGLIHLLLVVALVVLVINLLSGRRVA